MSKDQLDQIDQRIYNNLPPGPWQYVTYEDSGFYHIIDSNGQEIARIDKGWEHDQSTARFMTHARFDMVELIHEIQFCQHRITDLENTLERLNERPLAKEVKHA